MGAADEEWARNAFKGQLWKYLEVRCNTVTSLFMEVQEIVNKHEGAFMPFGPRNDRSVMQALDYSRFYPHLKRVSFGYEGNKPDEARRLLTEEVKKAPDWAEPEVFHNQRAFESAEELRDMVMMTREVGIRHHSFHYYGMSRRYELERIGHCRQAWE